MPHTDRPGRLILPICAALAATPALSGCQASRPINYVLPAGATARTNYLPPVLDAKPLSGGKITHYVPMPGLPAGPSYAGMLEACRDLPITSHSATATYVLIDSPAGKHPDTALIVGKFILIDADEVVRTMEIPAGWGGKVFGQLQMFTWHSVVLTPGSKWAKVGNARIEMEYAPYLSTNYSLIITLSDWQKILAARDTLYEQGSHEIRSVKVIPQLDPLGRY